MARPGSPCPPRLGGRSTAPLAAALLLGAACLAVPPRPGAGRPRLGATTAAALASPQARRHSAARARPRPRPARLRPAELERLREEEGQTAWILTRLRDPKAARHEKERLLKQLGDARLRADPKELVAVIGDLGKRGETSIALQVVERARGTECANAFVFTAAINACERGGRWEAALAILGGMVEDEVKPSLVTFNSAMSACARGRHWEGALALFQDMKGRWLEPTEATYSAMISACKGGQWQQALALKDEMLNSDMRGNVIVWTSLIRTCEQSRQPGTALKVYGQMKQIGFQPDLKTWHILLRACRYGGLWKRAVSLLQRMESMGCLPDARAYAFALGACRASGAEAAQQSLAVFAKMRDDRVEIDGETCATVMEAFEHTGQLERVPKMLEVARQKGIQVTASMYASAMRACSVNNDPVKMLGLFKEMQVQEVDPDAACYDEVIKELASRGQDDSILRLMGEMAKLGLDPGVHACAAALPIYRERGDTESMRHLYKTAVVASAKTASSEEVLRLFEDMQENELRPGAGAYEMAVSACLASRNGARGAQAAKSLLSQMHARRLLPRGSATAETVQRCLDVGQPGDALELFDAAGGTGLGPVACRAALEAYREVGAWEGALAVLEHLRRQEDQPLTGSDLQAAIAACRREGRQELVHKLQAEVRGSGLRSQVLRGAPRQPGSGRLRPEAEDWGNEGYGRGVKPPRESSWSRARRVRPRGPPREFDEDGGESDGEYGGGGVGEYGGWRRSRQADPYHYDGDAAADGGDEQDEYWGGVGEDDGRRPRPGPRRSQARAPAKDPYHYDGDAAADGGDEQYDYWGGVGDDDGRRQPADREHGGRGGRGAASVRGPPQGGRGSPDTVRSLRDYGGGAAMVGDGGGPVGGDAWEEEDDDDDISFDGGAGVWGGRAGSSRTASSRRAQRGGAGARGGGG